MELEIENTEVVSANNIQIEVPNSVEVIEGEKDYEVSVVKKAYTIIGDSIFIPSMYEDSPPWLKEFIETTLNVAVTNRDQSLIDRLQSMLSLLDYVPKNQYTEQINQIVSEDGIINSRIATLNSNFTDSINTTNATIAEINLTYASKNEAAAIASNMLSASLSGSGQIGSTLIQLQEAYADLESTTAQSINALESVMEGEINGNATAMETIRTYVGIDEAGASTGLGTLDIILNNIQNQVDGSISTWFYDAEPTLDNLPASEWTTTETRNIHLGDIYYDRLTGFAYRFAFEDIDDTPDAGVIYTWIRITDSDITKALADAAQAQETADGKITTYYQDSAPIAEGVGDIWIDSNDGNKMYRWNGSTWGSDLVGTMVASSQAITTLQTNLNSTNTTVGGHTTQLNTVDTRITNGVAAVETKWAYNSVVNINGASYQSGFGLATSLTSGSGLPTGASEFWIKADKFKLMSDDGGKKSAYSPFSVDATTGDIKFNGKVTFSNVTDVPSLGTSSNNLLTNSAPTLGNETYGWHVHWYNTNIAPNAVAAGFDTWRPTGAGSVFSVVSGAPTVGTVFDIGQSNNIPVVAGKRYEISALLSSHRCTSQCTLAFYNSAGTYTSEIGVGLGNGVAYSGALNNWVRQGGFVTVPAGTSYAKFYVRSTVTSTDPYCFVSQAYMGEVPNDKTEFSSWSEGVSANSTTIDGGKITTGSITAAQINVSNLFSQNIAFTGTITGGASGAGGIIKSYDGKMVINLVQGSLYIS